MKIVATTRTKNEEENIERFCRAYIDTGLADLVLIADGGSDDDTVAIAESVPNVKVGEYSGQIFGVSGSNWRNPHGEQMNYVFDWATEEGADWIIFDDCDCVPNYMLKENGRRILEQSDHNFAFAVRLYFWGESQWFPGLSKDRDGEWMTSLWAWRAHFGFRASEADPWSHEFIKSMLYPPEDNQQLNILPPLALLHRPWPTEEKADAKREFYRAIGQHPKMKHPTEFGGQLEAIPEWMKD